MKRSHTLLYPVDWAMIAIIGILTMLKIVYGANAEPKFEDEIINSQAACNFFKYGNYTSLVIRGIFPPAISTGLATTWLSGVVLLCGGSLFVARVAYGILVYAQVLFLVAVFTRPLGWSWRRVLGVGGILMAVLVWTVPYNFGFIKGLGELQGALFIGWAIACSTVSLPGAFLLLGCAVWGCKFIYLPTALLIGLALIISQPKVSLTQKLRNFIFCSLFFILPLLIWILIIFWNFGYEQAGIWFKEFCNFVMGDKSGIQENVNLGLWERLHSSNFEWNSLPGRMKARMVGYYGVTAILFFVVLKGKMVKSWLDKSGLTIIAIFIGSSLIYAWYFRYSQVMWPRHLQPAIYLCIGLCTFLLVVINHDKIGHKILKPIFIAALFFIMCFEIIKTPVIINGIQNNNGFGRHCTNVFDKKWLPKVT